MDGGSGGDGVVATVAWDDGGRISRRRCRDGSAVGHGIGIGEEGQIEIRDRETGFGVTTSPVRIEDLLQFRRLELFACGGKVKNLESSILWTVHEDIRSKCRFLPVL